MDTHLLLTYLLAITLLTITPGVDTMLVIRNTARGGWQDGVVSSAGICSGLFVHGVVSAVGISVILLQTAWLFSGLKLLGALYLVWLGIGSWRSVMKKSVSGKLDPLPAEIRGFRVVRSLREGFFSNVLNPKTALFYMAFLPQFIDPAGSALLQSLVLAGLHFLLAMAWQSLLALCVCRARAWFGSSSLGRVFHAVTGTVLIGLGFRLATDR